MAIQQLSGVEPNAILKSLIDDAYQRMKEKTKIKNISDIYHFHEHTSITAELHGPAVFSFIYCRSYHE